MQMKRVFFVILLFVTGLGKISAQESDTIRFESYFENIVSPNTHFLGAPYAGFIIPAIFISYGFLAHNQNGLRQLDVRMNQGIRRCFTNKIQADDYIQYTPAIAVFGVDLLGIKAKHNFRDRTFLVTSSYLLSSASVHALKRVSHVRRPDESNILSFPSGHTATAFVGAHLLFKEYKDVSPWIGIAGYTVASITGAIRVLNRRHWVSDVVAGAGVGMLSVEISYLLLPVFQQLIGVNERQTSLTIAPVIGPNTYGVGIACTF